MGNKAKILSIKQNIELPSYIKKDSSINIDEIMNVITEDKIQIFDCSKYSILVVDTK